MISLYIHIPFCDYKCEYCNFYVIQKNHPNFLPTIVSDYIISIKKELDMWRSIYPNQQIRTIYLWWGTPSSIWKEHITDIIDHIVNNRDISDLEELSMEFNPDPFDENIELIKYLGDRYKNFPRIRFSFGIQSFDDEVLKLAGRNYVFNNIKWFVRNLQPIKKPNMVYNFDMIAFGTLDSWNDSRRKFWEDRVWSQMADSFSIYTLELFEWSKRHQLSQTGNIDPKDHLLQKMTHPDDDKVMEEFDYLKSVVETNNYKRYETSNFAKPWSASVHNQVYWNLYPYLGIWASASWFIYLGKKWYEDKLTDYLNISHPKNNHQAIRYTNTTSISDYIKWNYIDPKKITILDDRDILIEWFFLKMRSWWVTDISKYKSILTPDIDDKISNFVENWLVQIWDNDKINFTKSWYDLSNAILSEMIIFDK